VPFIIRLADSFLPRFHWSNVSFIIFNDFHSLISNISDVITRFSIDFIILSSMFILILQQLSRKLFGLFHHQPFLVADQLSSHAFSDNSNGSLRLIHSR
jgi:hypothetical protein